VALLIGMSASGMGRIEALSQIETGDNDGCIGPDMERGRTQISPAVCVEYHIDPARLVEKAYCIAWTEKILSDRISRFSTSHRRQPSDKEIYLLWHRPGRVDNPTRRESERAQRFANLVEINSK